MNKLKGLFARKEDIKPKLLSFREFCQYVYEPSKRIRSLNLSTEETAELIETIEKRKVLKQSHPGEAG
jgi:hypothetical protein